MLSDAELAEIRARAPHTIRSTFGQPSVSGFFPAENSDALALLDHIDALTERLVAAERVVEAARPHGSQDATLLRMWADGLGRVLDAGPRSGLVVYLLGVADALAAYDAEVEHANPSESETEPATALCLWRALDHLRLCQG